MPTARARLARHPSQLSSSLSYSPIQVNLIFVWAYSISIYASTSTARPYFKKASELDKSSYQYASYFSLACIYSGNIQAGLDSLNAYTQAYGESQAAYVIKTMSSNYPDAISDEQLFDLHKKSAELTESTVKDEGSIPPREGKKIRVAYLSPDFKKHSVAYFVHAIVEEHCRDKFEVYCYSDVTSPDEVTQQIKSYADQWVDSAAMDNDTLCARLKSDNIDIAVDLAGYSGRSRASAYAKRAAPLQMTYLGYPNTTGLQNMDYRITDKWADPEGMTESQYTEQSIRLPSGFLCYTPETNTPEVSALPADKREGAVCFGSFNSLLKITPSLLRLWAKILLRVPNASLFMKTKPLAEEARQEQIWSFMEDQGIARNRIKLQGWSPDVSSHLELYSDVDIQLDSFPYNGTTTTVESLRQGVPIITLSGTNHRSRVGHSLLTQVGLCDLIATDENEYIEIATKLAKDTDRLRSLRASLRSMVDKSAMMDRKGFISELENAYLEAYQSLPSDH